MTVNPTAALNHRRMNPARRIFLIIAVLMVALGPTVPAASAQDPDWTDQFGSTSTDRARAVAVGEWGVYVAGRLPGQLAHQTDPSQAGMFVRRYDHQGNVMWTQWVPDDGTWAFAVAADESGVYVGGHKRTSVTSWCADSVVHKYSPDGDLLWTQQFGTPHDDVVWGLATSGGAVYAVGHSGPQVECNGYDGPLDTYLHKYDASGGLVWARSISTPATELAGGVAADASGVYVAGRTNGTLPGQVHEGDEDSYVRKYDHEGTVVWTRQFGTPSNDLALAIALHSSGVYVGGTTRGPLADAVVGHSDAFIRKYSLDGEVRWTRQFGDSYIDSVQGLAVDESGVHSIGSIYVPPPIYPGVALVDASIQSYNHSGNSTWTQRYGTDCDDRGTGIAVHSGQAYIVGETNGTLPGETSASNAECSLTEELPYYDEDVFVARFAIPAPASTDGASPEGSVQVADGRTYSTSAGTTLSLQASDPMPRTGVASVRVSNDGAAWSGWRSYSVSQPWTLSAGDGIKEVRVQFKDASGNLSATASDRVTLDATAPAVSLWRPVFATGSQVSMGDPASVRVLVRGTVADATSGVRRYIVQRSVDGGGYVTVQDLTLATPAASRSVNRSIDLQVGHSYRFRLVAYDAAGNRTIRTGPGFRVAAYQEVKMSGEDDYGSVTYPVGSWTRSALSSAYRSYVKGTTGAGKARLTFTGRAVAWVAPTSSTRGQASVCVDTSPCVAVDLSTTNLARKVAFVRSWASSGQHTLEIRTQAGKQVDVDAFVVLR